MEIFSMDIRLTKNSKLNLRPGFGAFVVSVLIVALVMAPVNGNAKKAGKGAAGGALIGAGIGLLFGAIGGDPGAGLAVGAAVGAGQGAYEGWKQDQDDRRTKQITDAIREQKKSGAARQQQPNVDDAARTREELTRFLGTWRMEGWVQDPGQERHNVTARVNGNIEMKYFVELAYIDMKVSGVDSQIWGTSTLGYDTDDGFSVSTRLNTLPEAVRAERGKFDQSNRSFVFMGSDYRVIIRFATPDRFIVETTVTTGGKTQQVESYTFTRV